MTLSTFGGGGGGLPSGRVLRPPPGRSFITASVFANIQINFHPALRQLTSGANTRMENTNPEALTRERPGPRPC